MSVSISSSGRASFYIPETSPSPGTALRVDSSTPTLFRPLKIRNVVFKNRIFMSPLGQFSAASSGPAIGRLTPYHVVHLGHPALKGAGLVFIEATTVMATGRVSPNDSGLWQDSQIEGVRQVADAIHAVGGKVGIQLAHGGRKGSMLSPFVAVERGLSPAAANPARKEDGGWPNDVVGPSAISWSDEGYWQPREMSKQDIKETIQAFADAAKRAVIAGVDVIELHGGHGYLLCSFNSPISNQRTDEYGGSFENRIRYNIEVIEAVRAVIPDGMPLFYRITSTEWMEASEEVQQFGSWDVPQSIEFAKRLAGLGVDLIDVSSGGNHEKQKILLRKDYQVSIAAQIRSTLKTVNSPLLVGAVGLITEAEQARDIVEGSHLDADDGSTRAEGRKAAGADAIFVGRQFMREPEWVLNVARQLGVDVQWPVQYGRAKY